MYRALAPYTAHVQYSYCPTYTDQKRLFYFRFGPPSTSLSIPSPSCVATCHAPRPGTHVPVGGGGLRHAHRRMCLPPPVNPFPYSTQLTTPILLAVAATSTCNCSCNFLEFTVHPRIDPPAGELGRVWVGLAAAYMHVPTSINKYYVYYRLFPLQSSATFRSFRFVCMRLMHRLFTF